MDRVSAALTADLDYDAMQFAMDHLAARSRARVVRFVVPEPATRANILDAYDRVLRNRRKDPLSDLSNITPRQSDRCHGDGELPWGAMR